MAKHKSHEIDTSVTVREAWLIRTALEQLLQSVRDDGRYDELGDIAKLSDQFYELWGDNVDKDRTTPAEEVA